ncbi:MAG: glycoside hydrolase family 57 protein [Candidatus Omnitrophica bacterium]|nr:glycoside hydrolase family 57 protein [Candidatus Omnitrophota bacterium]MCM8832042.1 glycoside hydrolase family 57 protein [Candidatus Omnitrophota bacterium]
MNKSPTKIIFLWHMHQPCYKAVGISHLLVGWVRLHGVKDYYGMAKIIEKFNVKVTFNFSGILLEQLSWYIKDRIKDYYCILTLKNPKYFTRQEKKFVIDRFFSVNFERFIKPNPRYLALYNKRLSKRPRFSEKDLLDLQVLFNLAWFHPYTYKEDKNLQYLLQKGKDYNQEDKEYIIKKQYEILSEIFPLYKKLLLAGKIELSLSPYYHPIMPLIFDTDIAKEFFNIKIPVLRFRSPSDCVWHLQKSKEIFNKIFGYLPVGSWPSEGSVSEDIALMYSKEGFNWIATDEGILFKSFAVGETSYDAIKNQRHIISQAYRFGNLNIFFRDRNLSDLISFSYHSWEDQKLAAFDLLGHFKKAHQYLKDIFKERFISIIMDGENAWAYYKNNGIDFLETIYRNLENNQDLSTTTPTEFLTNYKAKKLERLSAGSWINSDFSVWIGNKKNNQYWTILRRIKDSLSSLDESKKEKIKNYLYILEGSDWFWWNTFNEVTGVFKEIFYSYVEAIQKLLGKKISFVKDL